MWLPTGLLVFFPNEKRVAFASFIAFFFLLMQYIFRPYATKDNNTLAEVANFSLLSILLLVERLGLFPSSRVAAWGCIALSLLVLPTAFVFQYRNVRRRHALLSSLDDHNTTSLQTSSNPMHETIDEEVHEAFLDSGKFVDIWDSGEHSRRMLLEKLFHWKSGWALQSPVVEEKRRRFLEALDLPPVARDEEGGVELGIKFSMDNQVFYGKLFEPTPGELSAHNEKISDRDNIESSVQHAEVGHGSSTTPAATRRRSSFGLIPSIARHLHLTVLKRLVFKNTDRPDEFVWLNERSKTIAFEHHSNSRSLPYSVGS